ncbi:MAG: 30S ribosomal protein S18 [Actinomycetota bacterium]
MAKGRRRGPEPPRKTRKKGEEEAWQKKQRRKVCVFCRDRADHVDYKDVQLLRRFISDRGKIRARRVTGTCSQHQRDVAMAVKNAREMALLPYTAR